jgi:hypothetical protein
VQGGGRDDHLLDGDPDFRRAGHGDYHPALQPAAGGAFGGLPIAVLGAAGDLALYAGMPSGSVHVIVDVNCYLE